jgi:hypothetical protein
VGCGDFAEETKKSRGGFFTTQEVPFQFEDPPDRSFTLANNPHPDRPLTPKPHPRHQPPTQTFLGLGASPSRIDRPAWTEREPDDDGKTLPLASSRGRSMKIRQQQATDCRTHKWLRRFYLQLLRAIDFA